jgi:hypothetical protein
MGNDDGQSLGSAGELLAQAALLRRGWTTANVNSGGMMNAPAIDLVAMKGQRNIRIAVKSSGARGAMQWGVKDDWQSLFKGETHPHFVFIVWFNGTANPDAYRLFIVPAEVADRAAKEAHSFYHSHKTKKGETRKGVNRVVMFFEGNDSERSISRGFARLGAI